MSNQLSYRELHSVVKHHSDNCITLLEYLVHSGMYQSLPKEFLLIFNQLIEDSMTIKDITDAIEEVDLQFEEKIGFPRLSILNKSLTTFK